MGILKEFGACDCHSHVFGPFGRFALSPDRAFDPPESTIEHLASTWASLGIERAVLVQGSAHGRDPSAMLAAIALSPDTRRGVALLSQEITDAELGKLHDGGIRAARFNWIHHLLSNDSRTEQQRLSDAARVLKKIAFLAWHVEIHIDLADLHLVEGLDAPNGMPIVVDHMARIDLSAPDAARQVERLLKLLSDKRFWVKLSGADRLTSNLDDLRQAVSPMREIASAAPDRCVWGLDWPHVNLQRKRSDADLAALLSEVARNDTALKQLLIRNPEKLYGFPSKTAG